MARVIDFHSHLGDIFHQMKNVSFKMNVKHGDYPNPFEKHETNSFKGPLISDLDELPILIEASQQLCWENTIENLSAKLDASEISYICLYPILPCNSFEEMLAAAMVDKRMIPFTSADYTLPIEEMTAKLKSDIARGAKGLKIHPVLQMISLQDERVEAAVSVFGEAGLPVVSHCGANAYYIDEEADKKNTPEFGAVEHFIAFANQFPDYPLVAAHAGGLMGGEADKLAEGTKGLTNLYVDTTFRCAEDVKMLVTLFGRERVLFGTDNPFASHKRSMDEILAACGEDSELADMILYRNAAKLLQLL